MKISLDNSVYIDRTTGKPVEGKLCIYLANTDVLANTFTYEGNNGYVEAPNPVLLHSGLTDDSLFVELGLYRLTVYRYTGPEGQMSAESPDEYFTQIDEFDFGLDYDIAASMNNVVDTIGDLQNADPSLKFVTVLWHDTAGDCVPRQYFWDAGAQDNIDGGYVVGSEVSDTGRWILLWADEILPCTVYGVTPSNTSNLNLLLNYPDTVGSLHLVTAPCVRFVSGNYTPNFTYATDKELVFDGDAKFTAATFQCPRARVMGNQPSFIADFEFSASDAEAHSSWFRTLQGFWHCDAKYLFLDDVNYFTSTLLTSNVNLSGKVVLGSGRLLNTYANGVYFIVGANTSISGRIFSSVDFVRFLSDGWGDGVFVRTGTWDPGLISAGHHVQFDTTPDLDLFESTERWVSTMVERRARMPEIVWSDFTLDLQNRRFINSQLNVGLFRDIRNVYCNSLYINNHGADIQLHNVHADELIATCRYISVYDSEVSFSMEPAINAIWGYDSRINSSMQWKTASIQAIFERCWIGIVFNRVTNNEHAEALLSFTECQFQRNVGVTTKNLEMYRCKTDNGSIKIYPYKNGDHYYLKATLIGNNFNSASPIEFTKIDTIDGRWQEDCYDCILQWNIVGNTFLGNDEGLRMRYWQNRIGSYYSRTFAKMNAYGLSSVVYEGNVGKCPAEKANTNNGPNAHTDSNNDWYWVELGNGLYYSLFKPMWATGRLVPDVTESSHFAYNSNMHAVGGNGLGVKYRGMYSDELEVVHNSTVYPWSHFNEAITNGDFFLYGFSCLGKVEQSSPGHSWMIRFV